MFALAPLSLMAAAQSSSYVEEMDSGTGRGVQRVELRRRNRIAYISNSARVFPLRAQANPGERE